ncbi:MAG: carboxypeptidase regulatory-like domain-containing protein [Prolixibacteraceae bacterium]|nr:carboxypeptidase regulatory-like domain-containing protein [Prolixibacteraceae bacterium]
MTLPFFIITLLLIQFPFSLSAQRTISGHITDANDGSPIVGVKVFIANTMTGTTTDAAGYYRLKLAGEGSYPLVVSHVAYQQVFRDIEPGRNDQTINIAMQEHEFEEVAVSLKVRFRNKDVDLFWYTILGVKPSPKTIQPLNPEAVYYYYNSETQKLTVSCRVPLQIVNHETGFQIQYVLNYFTHDYKTDISSWEGQYMFMELESANYKQRNTWENNRKKIYRTSISSFIKALYQNSTLEDGFLFAYSQKQDVSTKNINTTIQKGTTMVGGVLTQQTDKPVASQRKYTLIDSDYFIITDPETGNKTFHMPSEWDVMLISFGKPVSEKDLENAKGQNAWEKIGLFRNHIGNSDDPVHIFPDGSYRNPIHFTPVFSSNTLSGLNMFLPIDYLPDGETAKTSANHSSVENEPSDKIQPEMSISDSLNLVSQRFEQQLELFPQEKIHLQTDKPYYLSGERIWFRSHVVDAATHVPAFYSNSVFVELFDAGDSVVCRIKTGIANDFFSGYITIPEDAPEGDYTLRAYTNKMKGLDEDYYFLKNIRIGDPMSRMIQVQPEFEFLPGKKIGAALRFSPTSPTSPPISPESLKISINDGKPMNLNSENGLSAFSFNLPDTEKQRVMLLDASYQKKPFQQYIRIPLPDDDFDVSFYPEGGASLAGCLGRTAFKAMQRDGTEIEATLAVYTQKGNEVAQFKTDVRGMGVIAMKPERGDKYYAIATSGKGQSKRFDLPAAQEHGYALTANWSKDRLIVQVCQPEYQTAADTLCLLIHTRGAVQDIRIWENTNVPLVFPKDFFLSGVSGLLLLTKDMMPVSERLVFVNNDADHAKVEGTTDRNGYKSRSAVEYTVHITDEEGEPLWGNFSVSVTDSHVVAADSVSNILTSLLLNSDLRGNIADPAYYFRKQDQSSVYALDLLMLTQGWRRYDTERIVRNDFMYPDISHEAGYELSGTVRYLAMGLGRPVANVGVSVVSRRGDFATETTTGHDGRFFLHEGEAPDSTLLIVQTAPQLGRQNLELILDKPVHPERTVLVPASGAPDRVKFAQYADKAEQQYVDEYGMRVHQLSEVTVTAQRNKPKDYSMMYEAKYATFVITQEDIEKRPPASMNFLLMQIPGVMVADDRIKHGRHEVGLMIDGFPGSMSMLKEITPHGVAQIDFLVGSDALMYTKNFEGKVIAIWTNGGSSSHLLQKAPNVKPVMPLGFQRPAEFYAPKYDTPERNQKPDLRTTIHWQPSITTDENGKASFSFYTADAPSTYTVVIEGMTADGRIVYKKDEIVVGD